VANESLLLFLATPCIRVHYLAHAQINPSGVATEKKRGQERRGKRREGGRSCRSTTSIRCLLRHAAGIHPTKRTPACYSRPIAFLSPIAGVPLASRSQGRSQGEIRCGSCRDGRSPPGRSARPAARSTCPSRDAHDALDTAIPAPSQRRVIRREYRVLVARLSGEYRKTAHGRPLGSPEKSILSIPSVSGNFGTRGRSCGAAPQKQRSLLAAA